MQKTNRVAINTIIQYIKLVVNILVGLISVRVLLNALGTNDYGIYDVVGGIIALLAFINSSLSQSSIRFLSVSLGKSSRDETRKVFNNCFWTHIGVSLVIVALFEIIGPFLFDSFLSIPNERLTASKIVYHCMIINLFLQIAITPFNALIVSHEKFVYTSFIAILDSFLKLAIAFSIKNASVDKLMLYGILMASVTVLNSFLYFIYVWIKYRHELYVGRFSLKGSRELLNFVGWTILDILSQLSTRQGYAVMFNKFFGTSVNAVYALSRQIEGNFYYMSASVIDSMKPQIMRSYGEGDSERMIRLSLTAGKMGFIMMSLVAIPILVMMPTVLKLWLVNVPDGSVFFARIMILACLMEQLTKGLVYSCQATGNIKFFSIIVSIIRFSALPLSIIFFVCGFDVGIAMVLYLGCETLGSFSRVIIMSKITDLKVRIFIKSVILRIIPPVLISALFCYCAYQFDDSLLWCFAIFVSSLAVYSILCFYISLDKLETAAIIGTIRSFWSKVIS